MKLQSKITILALFFCILRILTTGHVLAQSSLEVDFENEPLFSEINFLPKDSVNRWIKVTNNSGQIQSIIIEPINVADPDNFSSVIDFKILKGTNVLFDDTLQSFLDSGEIILGDINDQTVLQFDLSATFLADANNNYQGDSLSFDILIGFAGTDDQETDNPVGGGGGGTGLPGLSIKGESVRIIDIQETTATIKWDTSYFSTSQVIYAKEGESHDLDLDAVNFGYAHSYPDPEDFTKVTGHSVTIPNLDPGETYYFRCVSHASPASISKEYNFITNDEEVVYVPQVLRKDFIKPEKDTSPIEYMQEEKLKQEKIEEHVGVEQPLEQLENIQEKEIVVEKEPNNFFAAVSTILNSRTLNIFSWIILLVMLGLIIRWIIRLYREKKK